MSSAAAPSADLAGHRGGDTPARGERLQLRHLLQCRPDPRRLIGAQAVQRCDLTLEGATRERGERAAVALQREFLHLPA